MPVPQRDPFAKPGDAGNRGISYGDNGAIPTKYRPILDQAISVVYGLWNQPNFPKVFATTVVVLSDTNYSDTMYLDACNKAIINLADTTTDSIILGGISEDPKVVGFSHPGQANIWLKQSLLDASNVRDVASTILHEISHVAGANADYLAEVGLEKIHAAAGLKRVVLK